MRDPDGNDPYEVYRNAWAGMWLLAALFILFILLPYIIFFK